MKKLRITLASVIIAAAVAMSFTSCGGDDNTGMTDGTVSVKVNGNDNGNGNGNGTNGNVTANSTGDVIDNNVTSAR